MTYTVRPFRGSSRKRKELRSALYRLYGPNCCYCGCELLNPQFDKIAEQFDLPKATLEHLIQRSKGGGLNISNLALACGPCNNSRDNNMNIKPKLSLIPLL